MAYPSRKRIASFAQAVQDIHHLNLLSRKMKCSKSQLIRDAIALYLDKHVGGRNVELTWKDFVIMCCKSGVTNSSAHIAQLLQDKGYNVTKNQVAAVKANWTMGKYND